MLADDFNLQVGTLENTNYIISYRLEENQKILDIIYTALSLTSDYTGNKFVFFDDFGKLTLKSLDNMTLPLILDCTTEALAYSYQTSIDDDVYNSIKVSVNNTKLDYISTYTKEDPTSLNKWGTLQYFKKLSSSYSKAQAEEYALSLLNQKNRLAQNLEIKYIGNTSVRAGSVLTIILNQNSTKTMIVDYCKHIIKNNEHIMELSFQQL